MIEIKTKVYEYKELDKDVQDKLYDKYVCNFDYPWRYEAQDTLDKFCEIFNIDIKDLDYDYKYCSFTVDYDSFDQEEGVAQMSPIRLRTFILNNFFDDIYKGKYYFKGSRHKYSKVFYTKDCPLTGYCFDMDILDTIWDFIDNPMKYRYTTYEGIIEECIDNYIKAYNNDYDNMISREYFEEEVMQYSDRYFYEDGTEVSFEEWQILA